MAGASGASDVAHATTPARARRDRPRLLATSRGAGAAPAPSRPRNATPLADGRPGRPRRAGTTPGAT
eukprot:8365280-Lingulodinium_polyedra.AAC.1